MLRVGSPNHCGMFRFCSRVICGDFNSSRYSACLAVFTCRFYALKQAHIERTADMASSSRSQMLAKRTAADMTLMPPPPVKRIKRPSEVLDEDEYTDALSDIIARDYFPGLHEAHAQQEYLSALESKDEAWIAEAAARLRRTAAPLQKSKTGRSRSAEPARPSTRAYVAAGDTPLGHNGSETPTSAAAIEEVEETVSRCEVKTHALSLSGFQEKFTSEDNESFNTVLDKQNKRRREKHAYAWSADQRLPSARQIAQRERDVKLLKHNGEEQATTEVNSKALIPISTGATASRPAKPDAWKISKPDNTFMFNAPSIDESNLPTTWDLRQATSKAGPRQIIHENTRFPPLHHLDEPPSQIPPSPSLNTDIIAARDAQRSTSTAPSSFAGDATPRVAGYAFVDEDEPDPDPAPNTKPEPTYRDLLAGQVGDSTPNPFRLSSTRKREDLHHRLVEEVAVKKRVKEKEVQRIDTGTTPGGQAAGNMTPAGRMLMAKLGRTPVHRPVGEEVVGGGVGMWTPGRTPRRKAVK